ncbi:hypothetical protein SAMN04487785_102377 [Dyella jiangningensis]|uniref:hypothetical protein n=1 Tax=Dyella sp. AtDHG13 TaxID=1938897 RepID=UPI00088869A4|nr:hypothetical protein [Dyella sp. AtDHG13]PXV60649.1 hypothetical protein BDW41_102376 [Dyella sp. AtDHG13]SDJ53737.1 hypothetical protein SAMN04487785_102377 [Dyella jiangningensis]
MTMAYTKPDQTPFTKLQPNEFVVNLTDTGQNVAVSVVVWTEDTSANASLRATARVVQSDGSNQVDANGDAIVSAFAHTTNVVELAQAGGMPALQKQMLLAVLGEATTLWSDPIHTTDMQNASIRASIATAGHAGPVADPGSLL